MTQFILDIFFSLVFVLLFIFLIKIKERTFIQNKESFRYTISGISVLFLTSLLRLMNHQNLFDSVPFLSENIYFDLSEAIGIVTGMALMIAGVSIWLPIKRRTIDSADAKVKQYSLIQKILNEIILGKEIDRLFEFIPVMICEGFGFTGSAVFRLNHRQKKFVCTNLSNPDEDIKKLKILRFKPDMVSKIIEEFREKLKIDYPLYLKVDKNLKAIILFWKGDEKGVGVADKMAIEKIGQAFSYRLKTQFLSEKKIYIEDNWRFMRQMQNIISLRKDIKSNLRNYHDLFFQAIGAEYFSLAVLDRHNENLRRFTIGMDRKVLLESGSCPPIENSQIETVMANRKSLLIDDIVSDRNMKEDSLFNSCGQRCLLAVPIINYDRVIGVLTVGHPRAGYFRQRHLFRAEILSAVLATALEAEISRQLVYERDRYLGAIAAFDSIIQNSSDIESVLNSATDLLVDNVGTTMVRITVLNKERTDLVTKSLKSIRPFDNIRVKNTSVSKEMTPWHQMVMQENRPLLINQNDLETSMNANEADALVFENMQSALIVPIIVNGYTYGLITLGEMRNWDRFSYKPSAITFCKEIATRIGDAVKIFMLSRAIIGDRINDDMIDTKKLSGSDFRQELKSPLTNISGSLDLLKLKGVGEKDEARKIIANMEKSTNRIISLLNEETEKIPG